LSGLNDDEDEKDGAFSGTEDDFEDADEVVHSPFKEKGDGDSVLEAADRAYDMEKAVLHDRLTQVNRVRQLAGLNPLDGKSIDKAVTSEDCNGLTDDLESEGQKAWAAALGAYNSKVAAKNATRKTLGRTTRLVARKVLPDSVSEVETLFAVVDKLSPRLGVPSSRRTLFPEAAVLAKAGSSAGRGKGVGGR
jgi:hypothetical protein